MRTTLHTPCHSLLREIARGIRRHRRCRAVTLPRRCAMRPKREQCDASGSRSSSSAIVFAGVSFATERFVAALYQHPINVKPGVEQSPAQRLKEATNDQCRDSQARDLKSAFSLVIGPCASFPCRQPSPGSLVSQRYFRHPVLNYKKLIALIQTQV